MDRHVYSVMGIRGKLATIERWGGSETKVLIAPPIASIDPTPSFVSILSVFAQPYSLPEGYVK